MLLDFPEKQFIEKFLFADQCPENKLKYCYMNMCDDSGAINYKRVPTVYHDSCKILVLANVT